MFLLPLKINPVVSPPFSLPLSPGTAGGMARCIVRTVYLATSEGLGVGTSRPEGRGAERGGREAQRGGEGTQWSARRVS